MLSFCDSPGFFVICCHQWHIANIFTQSKSYVGSMGCAGSHKGQNLRRRKRGAACHMAQTCNACDICGGVHGEDVAILQNTLSNVIKRTATLADNTAMGSRLFGFREKASCFSCQQSIRAIFIIERNFHPVIPGFIVKLAVENDIYCLGF